MVPVKPFLTFFDSSKGVSELLGLVHDHVRFEWFVEIAFMAPSNATCLPKQRDHLLISARRPSFGQSDRRQSQAVRRWALCCYRPGLLSGSCFTFGPATFFPSNSASLRIRTAQDSFRGRSLTIILTSGADFGCYGHGFARPCASIPSFQTCPRKAVGMAPKSGSPLPSLDMTARQEPRPPEGTPKRTFSTEQHPH